MSNTQPSPGARPFVSPLFAASCIGLLGLAACSDSGGTGDQAPPSEDPEFTLESVSNGFGQQLPHRVLVETTPGNPVPVPLRTLEDVVALVSSQSPVLPPEAFPADAVLPDGRAGNQFFLAKFTDAVDPASDCFNACTGTGPCDLDTLEVVTFDPSSHEPVVVPARVFVGGSTWNANGDLEQWVELDPATGRITTLTDEAHGFPGSEAPLFGAADFVAPSSIMVVMDADGDLSTLEAFPNAESLQLRIPASLCSTTQQFLGTTAVAATSVGGNPAGPSVVTRMGDPATEPSDGMQNVDPSKVLRIRFTESIQPWTLGTFVEPSISPSLTITQAPNVAPVPHAYTVMPNSAYDLTEWAITPDRTFDGLNAEGPPNFLELAEVKVEVGGATLGDLVGEPSADRIEFSFLVGRGPAMVNAPVVPESLLISRAGTRPGLSVIDLNGFGQSTGSPTYSQPYPLAGQTRFPFDPNVTQNPTVRPVLSPGSTTLDGGSAGVFTLTRDANLNTVLAGAPILADAADLQFGASLDTVFDNSPPPFGCQAGGGNVCALSGLKTVGQNPDLTLAPGFPNLVSFAPHPNPPPLMFPAMCWQPSIVGREPSSIDFSGSTNLLDTGNPFPDPVAATPPTGLLDGRRGAQPFYGPSFGQQAVQDCQSYGVRQQIGQFLYVADRIRGEVVALNSNRMLSIDRLPVAGVTSMALGPNLDVLAVTSQDTDTVTIIDVDPNSATFHTILAVVSVGDGPRGIAFDPLDEDILVCNEVDSTISVISALTLTVRKTVPSQVDAPFELAVTPRMQGFGLERGVYFAYVLGRNGELAVFESGPDGPGGFGYDSVIGVLPWVFQAPRAIVLDPLNLDASVFVAYEGPVDPATGASGALGVGAISRVRLESADFGTQLLQAGSSPSLRDLQFGVALTLSEASGEISGIPSSLAFDELRNFADYPAPASLFTSGGAAPVNGKCAVREVNPGTLSPTNQPKFLFAAIPDAHVVDVMQVTGQSAPLLDVNVYDAGVQSIPAPNVRFLTGYFSQ
ncbi:hypothetical protein [Planctomycetes bacterium Poly30]|uniref:hypothetical protein n=1 Tax=Saltatorellus ferox TaxID=2528018 RepID=UPI00119D7E56